MENVPSSGARDNEPGKLDPVLDSELVAKLERDYPVIESTQRPEVARAAQELAQLVRGYSGHDVRGLAFKFLGDLADDWPHSRASLKRLHEYVANLPDEAGDVAPDPVAMTAELSRSLGRVRWAFPEEWRARVRKTPAMQGQVSGIALMDFAGELGLEAGAGYVSPEPSDASRRERAAKNAQALAKMIEAGEAYGFADDQVRRATVAVEQAMVVYFGFDGVDVRRRRAARITVLLEAMAGSPDAAASAHADSRFDSKGLGRITLEAWKGAFGRWRGIDRPEGPGKRPRDSYDWRDVVLDLLDLTDNEPPKRPEARRWLDDITGGRARPKS